ncbi:MAG TPA: hypothetical protein DHV08_02685 [Rhodocyclaceae bacterium]|nr:MAG: hypothetical protein AUK49_00320 [Betaproteobacteria bacterium CG2_30_68_42]PIV72230.1 MAG: hypothetical protein COW56_10300 [Rhodocyclales bacterium CG17_big_fil_post_rev_8_21_14_2_50_68_7]PIX74779.1 MAG: hypothetical protein COZ38_09105 [Rhodocyclales bacterium CG_4_10_14_3_um_filter_68_10]PJA58035.1 MAG: hypothetical protein CO164_04545 [Rhodocyclales bacterium CG_4_9_14_3_um_filter_68_10]HCX32552.1 hypothetical protein [Rhodocyclaceae bacterium]
MNEDFWLVAPITVVWAILAVAYALAPWGDMIGYAWVWGFGSVLFAGLAGLLAWRRAGGGGGKEVCDVGHGRS